MIFNPDLILLHAPSIYDFRKTPNLFGPISDVVPSTPVFEMYPIGFSSIAEYLEKNNIGVRIVNLAYRMLDNPKFDAEKMISRLKPKAFGIDLHWLVHAHGSIEIAKICKKYHPDVPVLFGGLASTYYHKELIHYPEIDYIVRGDSTEVPMLQLMQNILAGKEDCSTIPNLTWIDKNGNIRINPHTFIPEKLNGFLNNYKNLFKIAVKYGDIKSMTAVHDWWNYPITAIMTCKGCTHNCIICGGSHYSLKLYASRTKPAYRVPELIAEDIKQLASFTTSPIFIIGDLNQQSEKYADIVLDGLKKLKLKNHIVLELFKPASQQFFQKVADSIVNFNFEISPESHDEKIRIRCGKHYSNKDMEDNIKWALQYGCQKFDVYFMIGISGQTPQSVMETIDYCEYLIQKFGKRVVPFIAPLAPFLDPGSIAYENPEEYGYEIFYHTFEQHRTALTHPSWKYFLNYQTKWMTRDQIVDVTYEAGKKLNLIKFKYGLITEEDFKNVDQKIEFAQKLIREIDNIYRISDESLRAQKLRELKLNMERDSISTVCEKVELKWPVLKSGFKFINICKAILFN